MGASSRAEVKRRRPRRQPSVPQASAEHDSDRHDMGELLKETHAPAPALRFHHRFAVMRGGSKPVEGARLGAVDVDRIMHEVSAKLRPTRLTRIAR